jgi:hypothetical protein
MANASHFAVRGPISSLSIADHPEPPAFVAAALRERLIDEL